MAQPAFRPRLRDLVAGVVALVVPTGATLFATDVAPWPGWAKWFSLIGWLVAATILIWDGLGIDERLKFATGEVVEQRSALRSAAISTFANALLGGHQWLPDSWSWRIYVYDSHANRLEPSWPYMDADRRKSESFRPDHGVVGAAWSQSGTVLLYRADEDQPVRGIPEEHQERFRYALTMVATPIDSESERIGVLFGTCAKRDEFFEVPANLSHIQRVATDIGTVLGTLAPDVAATRVITWVEGGDPDG